MDLKTSEPFWLVSNGLLHSYPSLRENIETDILIVGAGITGSLIAHQCIADGYETVIIDHREVAHGSTSATTAMLQYEIDTPLHKLIRLIGEEGAVMSYRACSDAIDTLQNLALSIDSGSGFEKKKSLYFSALKKDLPALRKEFDSRRQHGFEVEWLEGKEIEDHYGIAESYGGILSHQGGSMDAFRFTHDLLHHDGMSGLRVFDKTGINDIRYHRNGLTVKTDTGYKIKAKKLVYCNGYESTEIIPEKIVDLISTYALVTEQTPDSLPPIKEILAWNTADPYLYLRATDDHRLLIGGEDEPFTDAGKREEMLGKKSLSLQNKLARLLPGYTVLPDFAWAGTFGETRDGLPYIGSHREFPHSYFVLGFGGNGITFSVAGMQLISDMLQGRQNLLAPYFAFGR